MKQINIEKPFIGLNTFPKEGNYDYSYAKDKWVPHLDKMPIIKPEQQSSLIKFRSPTPLPQGNQDLPFGNYTQIGMKIKPDGTKFIYDRLGRTDKTVTIDDPRIGHEYYLDELFKDVSKDTPIFKK